MNQYTAEEMMTIAASRKLKNGVVCFVGIGLPSAAANLARLTHAPDVVLIYESGTIGTKPNVLPLSIGDGELSESAQMVVSVPEMFRYWLQGGWVDVGFLGAAQIDKFANINTTVIGDYHQPKTRLPGAGGAPEISTNAKESLIILKQSKRAFVEKVSFITSPGHLSGGDAREKAGLSTKGPTAVITDLGVLAPDPVSKELVLVSLHEGSTVEQAQEATGWHLKTNDPVPFTPPPTPLELSVLRDLNERTALAHSGTH
ncbi:MAG: CoA-transferase subunit beta [SAR324 cluster bacterium]|nr:CoA-transferase subunit beta [SAR324 cluster bacterium]